MIATLQRRSAAALALAAALAACYVQRPLDEPSPEPGARIVAEVTDSGMVAMGTALGPGAVEVEGVIVAADAATWSVQMIRVDHRDGSSILWSRELVSFPRSVLTRVSQKRLDPVRSWVAAGVVVGTALLAARLFKLVGSDETIEPIPIPQERVSPGFETPE